MSKDKQPAAPAAEAYCKECGITHCIDSSAPAPIAERTPTSKLAHEIFEKAKRQPTALHAVSVIEAALEAAIRGEREACAELAELHKPDCSMFTPGDGKVHVARQHGRDIAAAIRDRSKL